MASPSAPDRFSCLANGDQTVFAPHIDGESEHLLVIVLKEPLAEPQIEDAIEIIFQMCAPYLDMRKNFPSLNSLNSKSPVITLK